MRSKCRWVHHILNLNPLFLYHLVSPTSVHFGNRAAFDRFARGPRFHTKTHDGGPIFLSPRVPMEAQRQECAGARLLKLLYATVICLDHPSYLGDKPGCVGLIYAMRGIFGSRPISSKVSRTDIPEFCLQHTPSAILVYYTSR